MKTSQKPRIITINTIRGGSGKTLFCILLSKYLPGKKLLIDTDIQNSLSFWSQVKDKNKNFFNAIINQDIKNNIQKITDTTDIIISEIKLLDIQNLEPNRFTFIKEQAGEYEYIIIDTAPTYSGIIYNCFQISDLIILPCMLDMFSFKSLTYTLKKIKSISSGISIKVFINQYEKSKSDSSYLNQLLQTIQNNPEISKYLSEVIIPKSIFFKQLNDNMLDEIPEQARTKELLDIIQSFIGEVQ
jgi:cellulose biosynthesis protein BcsQ